MANARTDPINNFFPIISMLGFALAWYVGDIYIATATLMGLLTVHIALLWGIRRHVPKITLVTWALVIVLGALTLILRDKAFIQLKTTIVYSVLALALFIADRMDKNLIKIMLGSFFAPPPAMWRRVSTVAALYFLALAGCNFFVAKYFSEGVWVGVKTFAFPAATIVFSLLMVTYLYRYIREDDTGKDKISQ
ncbi:MAG: septation protein IspZ [Proteobacteria bacterium]|nr:septation protein IspZ [Pseudomonadota bacterium]MCH9758732.1 septation protein IspZ [Pseudomonadota bacterium]